MSKEKILKLTKEDLKSISGGRYTISRVISAIKTIRRQPEFNPN